MCGISGAVGYIDDRIQYAVHLMNEAQIHRGPDGKGIWSNVNQGCSSNSGVALAHRRLSILDLSDAGNQPMYDIDSGSVLVYNGEIYNFKDIRKDLSKRGLKFFSDCDTEVLLKLLVADGLQSLKKCNGMFSFALWNPANKVLTLGRDRMGIKPLYYTTLKQGRDQITVLFASELRALLASGLVERHIDSSALDTYLWNGFVSGSRAIVTGVSLLDAGTTLIIRAGKTPDTSERYWSLPKGEGPPSNLEEVAYEFKAAVSRRLISDVPLGIFLSGGIDSSAVATAAMQTSHKSIHTFNVSFPEVEFDESGYARDVANQLGTHHQCLELTEAGFLSGLNDALQAIDQPTFDAINTYFVSKAVREAGVTVALAGTGGDELFGGYTSFADLPRACKVSHHLRLIPETILRSIAKLATHYKVGRYGVIPPQTRWGKLGDILMARGDLVDSYQVSYSIYTQSFLKQLRPEHRNSTQFGLQPDMHSQLCSIIDGTEIMMGISQLELSNFISQRLLRDTDAASMAVSLEARVPFLDYKLIEAVSRLPSDVRYQPLGKKQALKDIALSNLNAETFNRPKAGFVLPFEIWLRKGFSAAVRDTLFDAELCMSIGLEPDAVARVWKAFEQQAPGMYWSRVWVLYVLLYWCRKHSVTIS
jgi:asparagine synthase (glutamine-hydrolysing)